MKCQKALALLAIAGLTSFCPLAAQQKTEQPQTRQGAQPARPQPGVNGSRTADQRTQWKNADHQVASCVAIDNQEEVALARFAEEKLQNKDVQEFARMLIEDHSEFIRKLEQYAPEATQEGFLKEGQRSNQRAAAQVDGARTEPAQNRTTAQNQPAPRNPAQPQPRFQQDQFQQRQPQQRQQQPTQRTTAKPPLDEGAGALPIDFLQLHREIAQQCLNDTQDRLSEKKESEIDECFIGQQIAMHAAMKSKLQVLQRHASADLKELLAQGEETTTKHLERAEKLMKQLSDSSSSRRSSESQ